MENNRMQYKSGMHDTVIKHVVDPLLLKQDFLWNFSKFASTPLLAYSTILQCISIIS